MYSWKRAVWCVVIGGAASLAFVLTRPFSGCQSPPSPIPPPTVLKQPEDAGAKEDTGARDAISKRCLEIRKIIKDNYLWPIDEKTLDCSQGPEELVKSLNDPRTALLVPEEYKNSFECAPVVILKMHPGRIAYIKVESFCKGTAAKFDEAAKIAVKKKITGVVLDLRGNTGGLVDEAVGIASQWIKKGTIFTMRDNKVPPTETFYESNSDPHRLIGVGTVVLVDRHTASSSEIVAGALQEYGLANLIGQKTRGKGVTQSFFPLSDGSRLQLVTHKWFTPKGKCIHEQGIKPDIMVLPSALNAEKDRVLERALWILRADAKEKAKEKTKAK